MDAQFQGSDHREYSSCPNRHIRRSYREDETWFSGAYADEACWVLAGFLTGSTAAIISNLLSIGALCIRTTWILYNEKRLKFGELKL